MMHIVSLLVISSILVVGYRLSGRRYVVRGCRYVAHWKTEAMKRFLLVTGVLAAIALMVLCYERFYRAVAEMGFAVWLNVFITVICIVVLFVLYERFLIYVMQVAEHNSRLQARTEARKHLEQCRRTCERAQAGETILECCPALSQMVCPLTKNYEVQVQFNKLDILYALRREERRQRRLRERGVRLPRWTVLNVPFERVLTKKPVPGPEDDPKDRRAWMNKLGQDDPNQRRESLPLNANKERGKVIPFPGRMMENTTVELCEPQTLERFLLSTEDLSEDTRLPLSKLKTLVFNLGNCGFKAKDCGGEIVLKMTWLDESGKKCSGEWRLDKNSPDYRWVMEEASAKVDTEMSAESAQVEAPAQTC